MSRLSELVFTSKLTVWLKSSQNMLKFQTQVRNQTSVRNSISPLDNFSYHLVRMNARVDTKFSTPGVHGTIRPRQSYIHVVYKTSQTFSNYQDNLVFYNTSPPRMFLSLDLLWEYRIQHGANGPLYITSSYSTWIFCRGVSGFATDCPCGVWCRGLTTCLLHVGPPLGNRILNNSWAVGLT